MARYIDADLIKTVEYPPIPKEEETDSEYFYRCGWQDGIGKVLELPTADVVPTEFHDKCMRIEIEKRMNMERTGEWLKISKHHKDREQEFDYYEITCSECGGKPEKSWHLTKFCPNCGADMRGSNNDT